jgi:YjbE family integral membrane protein
MGVFSMDFMAALAAIVVIDLVLAGDNAIVIALAARNVPRHQQRQAMVWGAVGAVLVRTLLTLIVVWLLQFPGLRLVGGVMLVWIAYKLLLPEPEGSEGTQIKASNTFWGAIGTIVIADMVMGLDNVLGVAGAAHGNMTLVILGLFISIPVLVWGSSLLLRYVERYPGLVYVGAGVLAFTAAKMILSEPYIAHALTGHKLVGPVLDLLLVSGVLWTGFSANYHRLESKISKRLAFLQRQSASQPLPSHVVTGENIMKKVLVPVDGSSNSHRVARHIIDEHLNTPWLEVHVLNVQTPFSRHVSQFVSRTNREAYHREDANKALRGVRRMFDRAGVRYTTHVEVGKQADVIAETAQRLGCDHIVMSTARKNSLTRMLEASVTNRVLELTTVPVEIIAGDAVSPLERIGVPLAIASTLGLLFLAAVG